MASRSSFCGFPQLLVGRGSSEGRSGALLLTKMRERCSKTSFQSASGRRAFRRGAGQNRELDFGCLPQLCFHITCEHVSKNVLFSCKEGFPQLCFTGELHSRSSDLCVLSQCWSITFDNSEGVLLQNKLPKHFWKRNLWERFGAEAGA